MAEVFPLERIPTEDDVRQAVGGNLCRCGTYPNTVKAALAAAGALRDRREAGTR